MTCSDSIYCLIHLQMGQYYQPDLVAPGSEVSTNRGAPGKAKGDDINVDSPDKYDCHWWQLLVQGGQNEGW
jgi:hypothetical protein